MSEAAAEATGTNALPHREKLLASAWQWTEPRLVAAAEWANPILVKETRQALKSRQFVATFLIVLIACWVVSIGGVVLIGPRIRYEAAGGVMLLVYYAVLAFPLTVIVPYSAFRSIASEREDNTYDLLSISTLTPWQIIAGKLGSALLQMLVFLSAVSPCIGFTFLLKGVDVLTVALLIGYAALASLGLSAVALLSGTLVQVRYSQVIVSVGLVVTLMGAFYGMILFAQSFIRDSYLVLQEEEFWIVNLALLTLYATTFAIVSCAAAMRISFASENRSTPLRRLLLLQQACFVGWIAAIAHEEGLRSLPGAVAATTIVLSVYWYLAGTLMTSEWPFFSRRVQRSLPASKLGRWLLTWLNPGPGTGYMLAVSNMTGVVTVGLTIALVFGAFGTGGPSRADLVYFCLLSWGYVVALLGIGAMLTRLLRKYIFVSMPAGFLMHAIVFLAACGVPQVIHFMYYSTSFTSASPMTHVSNPVWTLARLIEDGAGSVDALTLTTIVLTAAAITLLLNLRWIAAETQPRRAVLPERVEFDEQQLHPEPEPKPSNPWDREAAEGV
ncbi:MAG: hypothetical protein AAGA92_08460 [Planctomycetota bacterium]